MEVNIFYVPECVSVVSMSWYLGQSQVTQYMYIVWHSKKTVENLHKKNLCTLVLRGLMLWLAVINQDHGHKSILQAYPRI